MKPITRIALGVAVMVMLCITNRGLAQVTTVKLSQSPHNLNNNAGVHINGNGTTGEICLPCHTPHNPTNSNPDSPGEFLWNHKTNWNQSYTMYTSVHSTRFSSTSSGNPLLDSDSRLCLSCHDGAIAVDSYGGTTGSHTMSGIADSVGVVGGGNLGTDLSTSHPVGVGYPGATQTNGVVSFNSSVGRGYIDPTQTGWGTTVTIGTTAGGAAVKLVNLPDGRVGVGCGTCHTPHTYTYKFVRCDNSSSQLCFKCHDK